MASDKILGIDLGTTNTAFGIIENGEPTILKNDRGEDVTPSIVAFRENGETLVGQPASNQQIQNPERTFTSVKRVMGREDYTLSVGSEDFKPEEISAFILRRMKDIAEDYVGEEINRAVITVPAYFSDRQRQATVRAGEIAGLEVERIINEPTAAAIAYGIDDDRDQTVLIFDLGGGTFDVSLLDLGSGVYDVIATNGNSKLGGDDWDRVLVEHFADKFEDEYGINLLNRTQARVRLETGCEEIKKRLSTSYNETLNLPYITSTEDGETLNLEYQITREHFNRLSTSLLKKIEGPTEQVLVDGGVSKDDVDDVILVGGSTRMPMVREKVEEIFGMKPKNHIDPDKAVAIGATIQAGLISGEKQDTVLLDVTPLTLGIEVQGGIFEPLIPRNKTIPTQASKIYSTSRDNQESVYIRVYQGEQPVASRNELLDEFILSGIPKAQAGTPQIEVSFSIDLDGIVNVSAEELATGRQKEVEIKRGSGIAGERVDEMRDRQDEIKRKSEKEKREKRLRTRAEELTNDANVALTDPSVELDIQTANLIEERRDVVLELLEEDEIVYEDLEAALEKLEYTIDHIELPAQV